MDKVVFDLCNKGFEKFGTNLLKGQAKPEQKDSPARARAIGRILQRGSYDAQYIGNEILRLTTTYQIWFKDGNYVMLSGGHLDEPLIARTSKKLHQFTAPDEEQAEHIRNRFVGHHKANLQHRR